MDNYNIVVNTFNDNACKLITSFDEFEEMRQRVLKKYYAFVKVSYIAKCGHISNVVFTNFKLRKTGLNCKDCVILNTKTESKQRTNTYTVNIEQDGYNLLDSYLNKYYEVKRTVEGCVADILIRKTGCNIDSWCNIQLKVNKSPCHNMYGFNALKESYKNMLLCCVNLSDRKIWIIPYNDINHLKKLNISIKSKYNKYLVNELSNINEFINKYYDICKHTTLDSANRPVSEFQLREHQYREIREVALTFIKFKYDIPQGTATDFMINNMKIQEKVLGYNKLLMCHLASNNGIVNNKKTYRTYRLGENDYYWLHSSIDKRFWIIPEQILFERKYISDKCETSKNKVLKFSITYNLHNKWLKQFEYAYDNINKDSLIKLFN